MNHDRNVKADRNLHRWIALSLATTVLGLWFVDYTFKTIADLRKSVGPTQNFENSSVDSAVRTVPEMVRTADPTEEPTQPRMISRKPVAISSSFVDDQTTPIPTAPTTQAEVVQTQAVEKTSPIAEALLQLVRPRDGRDTEPPLPIEPAPQSEPVRRRTTVSVPVSNSTTVPLASAKDLTITTRDGRLDLTARDAPISQVAAIIAQAMKKNLVFSAATDRKINVSLTDSPLDAAMDAILTSTGHSWSERDGIIFVTSLDKDSHANPDIQGRRVMVFDLDYVGAKDIELAVKGLLSPVGQVWVLETNVTDLRKTREFVAVEDIPGYLARVEEYILQVDRPPAQVLIQAYILQILLQDDRKHGIDFQKLTNVADTQLSIGPVGFANPLASQAFFFRATEGRLLSVIEMLQTTTDARTLAAPRLMVVNGQEARIQIGEQLGFRVTTTTQTSTLESVNFLEVGVVLKVTPRIARDGRVLMKIKPQVSTGRVNPNTGLPEEETTEVESNVLLSNGEGMVIGGLIQEKDTTTANKLPILGSIPLAGALFQRRQTIKSRSEIVIALIPHVLPYGPDVQCQEDADFQRAADRLTVGAIERNPRPYEPRMPDAINDWKKLRRPVMTPVTEP